MPALQVSTPWPEPGKGDLVALVAGLVTGASLPDIASATGVSVSTVQRRRRNPLVRQAVAAAQLEQRRQVKAQLGAMRDQALEVLEGLLLDDSPMVRLRAVTVVLTQAMRYELAADGEPGLSHSGGVDPEADGMLARQLCDDAWDIDLTSPPFEEEDETDADQE